MSKINKIEILAPAGGYDSVVAAVRSGADAVYVGQKQFSARASAHNFDEEELKKASEYCHIHGVKIYVAINTIVFDDEFDMLKGAILSAARADADALIVQNQGVARLARKLVPNMPLHASTQMSVHTAGGVQALYEMGFKRVVLAREMSIDEIKKAAEIPVELEVFVHGALCMCVSGQCYFSAMLGSRSGNRGACAQTCRLPFSVDGRSNGYTLSLKDNSLVNHIGELEKIGVTSAKIEGRMKRPEYVSVAVKACREQRDLGFVSSDTIKMLKSVFSRTGFTDGYFTGKLGKEMFGVRTKSDVVAADDNLLSNVRQGYKDEIKNVKLFGSFTAKLGKKPVLLLSDGRHTVESSVDTLCEKASYESGALNEEMCRLRFCKTGGTAYEIESIECDIEEGVFLPLSALNALRREAVKKLDIKRAVVHNYIINEEYDIKPVVPYRPKGESRVRARLADTKLSEAFKACELVFVPLFSSLRELERLIKQGFKIGVEVPRGMFTREEQIKEQLKSAAEIGVRDVLCHNIGALYEAKKLKMKLHGGFGLNLVNTFDLLWAEEYGLEDTELSFELTFKRINALGGNIERGILSYGYLPLMLCRNCPCKSIELSCKSCKNLSKVTDRKNKNFFLRCDGVCTEVLNCVPLFVALEEISKLSTNFHVLRFTVENYVENIENIRCFTPKQMLKDKITNGLYKRGVN